MAEVIARMAQRTSSLREIRRKHENAEMCVVREKHVRIEFIKSEGFDVKEEAILILRRVWTRAKDRSGR